MSATGFHPEPSAKAPWTRTMVLTVAYAGDDTAKAAPVRRARIKRFMLQLHKIVPPHCFPRGTASRRLRLRGITAGIYGWRNGFRVTLHRNTTKLPMCALGQKRTLSDISAMSALPPKADIAESDWHVRFVPIAGAGSFDTLMTPTCEAGP